MTITTLQFESAAPHVYEALDRIPRTGWVRRGVKVPETVKEHTVDLIRLVGDLSPFLTPAELDGLDLMLEVHDWPEVINGDQVVVELDYKKRAALLADKFEQEKLAMETLCEPLPDGQMYLDLWLRMENSDDPAAQIGRQLDKYQPLERALGYELALGIPMFQGFVAYAKHFIYHPQLVQRMTVLETQWRVLEVWR